VVGENGVLRLRFENNTPGLVVYFPVEGGLEVMQRTEGFMPNYYRALLVLLCHITLLSAMAIMAAAALSFPVASLTVGALFVAGLLVPWVTSSADTLVLRIVKVVSFVIPQFGRFNPIGSLVSGRAVTWGFVGQSGAAMVFIWGGMFMALATFFYYRRELARVIL